MEEPLRENIINCGDEPSVVLEKAKDGNGNFDNSAATRALGRCAAMPPARAALSLCSVGDMIEMGILDPAKVTRSALQNAASNVSGNPPPFFTPARG